MYFDTKDKIIDILKGLGGIILTLGAMVGLFFLALFLIQGFKYGWKSGLELEEVKCIDYSIDLLTQLSMDGRDVDGKCKTYVGDDGELHYRIVVYDIDNNFAEEYYYFEKKH